MGALTGYGAQATNSLLSPPGGNQQKDISVPCQAFSQVVTTSSECAFRGNQRWDLKWWAVGRYGASARVWMEPGERGVILF